MKLVKLYILVFSVLLFSTSASAQTMRGLQSEIRVIKEEVEALQRGAYRGVDSRTESSSETYAKVLEMEELFRQSTGKVEELEYKIRMLEEKLEVINKDMDIRFKMLEEKQNISAQASAPSNNGAKVSSTTDNITADVKGTIDEIYQKGQDALKAKNHQMAINAFGKIIKENPKHKLAGNAQYWLGETYYSQKDFKRAAIAFARGYENYKDSSKGADSLLKLGMSMVELKEPKNACAAFISLPKEFPKASEVLKNKAAELAKKNNCK